MKDGLLFQAVMTEDKFEIHENLAYSKSGPETRDLGSIS